MGKLGRDLQTAGLVGDSWDLSKGWVENRWDWFRMLHLTRRAFGKSRDSGNAGEFDWKGEGKRKGKPKGSGYPRNEKSLEDDGNWRPWKRVRE